MLPGLLITGQVASTRGFQRSQSLELRKADPKDSWSSHSARAASSAVYLKQPIIRAGYNHRSRLPYETWIRRPCQVPRIPEEYLDCAVYLYRSTHAAKSGHRSGGCGFLLAVEGDAREPLEPLWEEKYWYRKRSGPVFQYVATCRHVAEQYPVARLNRKGRSGSEGIPLDGWVFHEKSDLAVAPLEIDESDYEVASVSYEMLLPRPTWQDPAHWMFGGLGDDIFIVSRFIKHDGKQTNWPAVRFGNISVMPREDEPIFINKKVGKQVAYLTEVRTVPGASGSPVFLHIPGWELRESPKGTRARDEWELTQEQRIYHGGEEIPTPPVIKLVGIAGGFLFGPDEQVVYAAGTTPRDSDLRINRNAGMEWCVPSWKLLELLRRPELMKLRNARRKEREESPPSGTPG